jgi:hypothetical protein
VQVQRADAYGAAAGPWITVAPHLNVYDSQADDTLAACTFDPVDDGNDEDTFFDPDDPLRRLGPSSTCYTSFVFAWQGDTDEPFDPWNIGLASDGPGLAGSTGAGTWVEPVIDLSRFRWQRVRLRFLITTSGWGSLASYEQLLHLNPDPGDDGWFIDKVKVTDTLAYPATLEVDGKDNSALPPCGETCGFVSATLVSDAPGDTLPAPGRTVTLSAAGSIADRCLDGALQFRFWIDGAAGEDTLLRGWTDNPLFWDTPLSDTDYVVEVRCSTDPACADAASLTVHVDCPGGALGTIRASSKTTFEWSGGALDVDWVRGEFSAAAEVGAFDAVFQQTLHGATEISDTGVPDEGRGYYYLVKKDGGVGEEFCNSPSWGSAARNAALGNPGS